MSTETARQKLRIVILGGGTAGWMTAAALSSVVRDAVGSITLIESAEIGAVGVGEATIPAIREFNEAIGIVEADMMKASKATYKLGIEFIDWGHKGASYIHPFGTFGEPMAGTEFLPQYLASRAAGEHWSIEEFSYPIVAARQNRFEHPVADPKAINSTYSYAFHFDASLYANFLRDFSTQRGLNRIEGKITSVEKKQNSPLIAALMMEDGRRIEGDLFIDCSGFRSLLLGEEMGVPFEDWSHWLPVDRAWAVPSEDDTPLAPYTKAIAHQAGWQWRIPLQHRTGNGHVFVSSLTSEQEAADLLMANLPGKPLADPRLIKFKTGRHARSWQHNVVAIGLSNGFLEPLESTSIYLIQVAIMQLMEHLPTRGLDQALIADFNRLVDLEYDRVRDFLILHYVLNTREDGQLWRAARSMPLPASLSEKIENFTARGLIPRYRDGLFAPPSWISVFLGQGAMPKTFDPLALSLSADQRIAQMSALREKIAIRAAIMPDHKAFLDDFMAVPAFQMSPA